MTAEKKCLLSFRAATEDDYRWAFNLKTRSEQLYVERFYGTDLELQKQFFADEWQRTCPTVVLQNNKPIGIYSIETEDGQWFFRRFFIEEPSRGHGVGERVLQKVIHEFGIQNRTCHVAVFEGNRAIRLYEALGFIRYRLASPFIYLKRAP